MIKQEANKKFECYLLEAIDEGLTILGECIKTTIYSRLDSTFNIRKQEIPEMIEGFSDALEQIFGSGAKHLELIFKTCLHSKIMGISKSQILEFPEMTFKEYVELAKQFLIIWQEDQPKSIAHQNRKSLFDSVSRSGDVGGTKIRHLRESGVCLFMEPQNIYNVTPEGLNKVAKSCSKGGV